MCFCPHFINEEIHSVNQNVFYKGNVAETGLKSKCL